jgi:Xaa-Pro aminopeptidase
MTILPPRVAGRGARAAGVAAVLLLCLAGPGRAQRPLFTQATPVSEFAVRREALLARIGDGIAVLQGAAEDPAYVRFRQNTPFYYLTGVEVPRALLLLDGRSKRATLFLPPRNERQERSEGPVLVPGDEAARLLTGIDDVQPRDAFGNALNAAAARADTVVYTPFRPETRGAGTPDIALAHGQASAADPWDGRRSREETFVEKLKAAAPGVAIRDLDPLVDAMRVIKSPHETALIREATRIAGDGIRAAMAASRPGRREYELEAAADYVFKQRGSQGVAYFALVAAGANAIYPHYHAGGAVLKDGDLVLFDYAPDFNYYTSDVTRMFPANGTFSPAQRELYGVYLQLYTALMESIHPGLSARAIASAAVPRMDAIVSGFTFSKPQYRDAARAFVNEYREFDHDMPGHFVGMAVHDVRTPIDTLKPGMVFTIEPALTVPDERIYIRLEDVILVTADGYENLSADLPEGIDAIEDFMREARSTRELSTVSR